MGGLNLPHTLDIYVVGAGGTQTLARAGVSGYFESVSAEKRVWLQSVTKKPLMLLWLALSARDAVTDGRRIFWRQGGSWWNVRGAAEVFEGIRGAHIEVLLSAETADGLFTEPSPMPPIPPIVL